MPERCGDHEGARRALLLMVEETGIHLDGAEKKQISNYLEKLLSLTQQTGLRFALKKRWLGFKSQTTPVTKKSRFLLSPRGK